MANYRSPENVIRDLYKERGRKISDDSDEDVDHISRGTYVNREEPTMCGPNPSPVVPSDEKEMINKTRRSRGQHYHRVSESSLIRSILNKNK